MSSSFSIQESAASLISEGTHLEGTLEFDSQARIFGSLKGKIIGQAGSTLVLAESGKIEGEILADTLIVDGFVQGQIKAQTRVVISATGRVIGDIYCPNLKIEFGAHFEGRSQMESKA